jgi:WD40 repeat protein
VVLLAALSAAAPTSGLAVAPPPAAARADRHGDALPPGAVARLGSARFLHPEPVLAAAFSPDGKRLATLSGRGEEHALWLWEVPSGKKVGRFPLPFRLPEAPQALRLAGALAYSPDGRLLEVLGRERVHLLGARTGKVVRSLGEGEQEVSCAAFSRDGRTIAVGYQSPTREGCSVALWDVNTG